MSATVRSKSRRRSFYTQITKGMMKKERNNLSNCRTDRWLIIKGRLVRSGKKVCTLMLIAVAVRMDIMLGTTYICDAVCISFCLNELLSIAKNTSLMGILYPPAIKKAIDVLQTKVGRIDDETTKKFGFDHGFSSNILTRAR